MLLVRIVRRKKILSLLLSLIALMFIIQRTHENESTMLKEDRTPSYTTSWRRPTSTWSKVLSLFEDSGKDVIGTVQELKWFEKYVLHNDSLALDLLNSIQTKVFPYLNIEAVTSKEGVFGPVWKRWDKKIYVDSVPRFSSVDSSFLDAKPVRYDASRSFWWNWSELMTQTDSRGIVISVGDQQAYDTIRLIKVLRSLKNKLPIQILHKGDLSIQQQERLIDAARRDESEASPPQELWFADIAGLLDPRYIHLFRRFSNKWLALLFCSFENPILLDADTVPFTSLHHYYDFPQFRTFGSLLFKDRRLTANRMARSQNRTLKKIIKRLLTPDTHSGTLSDKQLYSTIKDPIALESLKNMLEKRQKHHVDSGLVLLNKKRHLFDILTALALQFSSICEYFHGDKDWFFISPLLRGVPYSFYPVEASTIGKLEVAASGSTHDLLKICSIQLVHTDVHDSLLWLNGGLNTCKLNSWQYDFSQNKAIRSTFGTPQVLQEYYSSSVQPDAIILPDPEKHPWMNTDLCAKYQYCAFYSEERSGKLIRLTDTQKSVYQKVSDAWHSV